MSFLVNLHIYRARTVSLGLAVLLAVAVPSLGQRDGRTVSADRTSPARAMTRVQLNEEAIQEVIKQLNDPKRNDMPLNLDVVRKFYSEPTKWSQLDQKTADFHVAAASTFERSVKSLRQPELLEISGLAYRRIIENTRGRTQLRASSNYCAQLLRQNRTDEAIQVMEAVRTTMKDGSLGRVARSRSLYNYGKALQLSGEFEHAYVILAEALEADPTFYKAAQAAGDAALKSHHETTGIPQVVALTDSQLKHFDYNGAARNLRQAMQVKHWIGHQLYPRLLRQLVRYFTAARIEPKVFEQKWSKSLFDVQRNWRFDDNSKRMIEQIRIVYSGRLSPVSVDPKLIRDLYAVWGRSTDTVSQQPDLDFLSSFIKMVGDYYYRQGERKNLEKSLARYAHAWALNVKNMEAGLYLANVLLYELKHPEVKLDPQNKILQQFISQLFHEKGREYRRDLGKDWERILKCHIVLATIFEQQRVWGPDSNPRTALFQWNLAWNALDRLDASAADTRRRFGPVIAEGLRQAEERWIN